jgi:hypothetical protein
MKRQKILELTRLSCHPENTVGIPTQTSVFKTRLRDLAHLNFTVSTNIVDLFDRDTRPTTVYFADRLVLCLLHQRWGRRICSRQTRPWGLSEHKGFQK